MTAALLRPAAALAAGAALALPAPAFAHWSFARWGMKADEVIAASGGTVRKVRDKEDQRVQDQLHLAQGSATEGGVDYEVNFYFDPKNKLLTVVDLVPADADCAASFADHQSRFGSGETEMQTLDDTGPVHLVLSVTKWREAGAEELTQFTDVTFPPADDRFCKVLYYSREF